METPSGPAARTLWRSPAYLSYVYMRFSHTLATQMQTVAVGWAVYVRTESPFYLGLIGLSQFAPALILLLLTGAATDRFKRNTLVGWCLALKTVSALGLAAFILNPEWGVWPVFAFMVLFGIARAFHQPAQQALIVNLVPLPLLPNAIAMNTAMTKVATITGPVLGGLLYAWVDYSALVVAAVVFMSGILVVPLMRYTSAVQTGAQKGWDAMLLGFRYVRQHRVLFGAISLDMVAVLLGGIITLLPVFARDVLGVGPEVLGLLYASPAVGGIIVALIMSARPIRRKAGKIMLATVAIFGLSIAIFSVSQSLILSLVMLFIMGASDMVSVNLRQTVVQVRTPDAMRGRVSAINAVFIGASNEIGQFRGGIVATLIGATPSGVVAGLSTLAVVWLWRHLFPELYNVEDITGDEEADRPPAAPATSPSV